MSENKRIKIIWICPGFAAHESDTTVIPVLQDFAMAIQQDTANIELEIISLHYPPKKEDYLWHGIKVSAYGGNNERWRKPFLWRKIINDLARRWEAGEAFILHAFWLTDAALITSRLQRKYGIPALITAMGQDVHSDNKYLALLELKNMVLVSLNSYHQKLLQSNVSAAWYQVIPWGLPEMPATDSQEREVDIIGVGSINEVKNWPLFLQVVKRLQQDKPDLKVLIIGATVDPKLWEALEEKIRLLDLTANINYLGELPRADIFHWMRKSKVLLHTSHFESMAMVVLEALSCGTKVVMSDFHIYEPSSQIYLSTDFRERELDMYHACSKMLRADSFEATRLFTMENVIEKYTALYALLFANIPAKRKAISSLAKINQKLFRKKSFDQDVKALFQSYFEKNRWGNAESVSGPGSTLAATSILRKEISNFLKEEGIKSLLDAGCGDHQWMAEVDMEQLHYIGVDVVEALIQHNTQRYASSQKQFICLNIIEDALPTCEALICRDVLVHLNQSQALAAVKNFYKSGASYLLLTDFPEVENRDIVTGEWRMINFEASPYHLPTPWKVLADTVLPELDGKLNRKRLAVWKREQLDDIFKR